MKTSKSTNELTQEINFGNFNLYRIVQISIELKNQKVCSDKIEDKHFTIINFISLMHS
jgi:hypothetical protein